MTPVFVVRHGNTFAPCQPPRRVGARTDPGLVHEGRAQARRLGDALKGTGIVAADVSPLARTRETARLILARAAPEAPIVVRPFLREIDYGPDENRLEAEVRARVGAHAIEAWERRATPPRDWRVDPSALLAGWRALFVDCAAAAAPRLVVTSNGIARFAFLAAGGLEGRAPKLRTGAYGLVDVGAGEARVAAWDVRPGEAARQRRWTSRPALPMRAS